MLAMAEPQDLLKWRQNKPKRSTFYVFKESLLPWWFKFCREHPDLWGDKLRGWITGNEIDLSIGLQQKQVADYFMWAWEDFRAAAPEIFPPMVWTHNHASKMEGNGAGIGFEFATAIQMMVAEFPRQPDGSAPDWWFLARMVSERRTDESQDRLVAEYAKSFNLESTNRPLAILLEEVKNAGYESLDDFIAQQGKAIGSISVNALECLKRGDLIAATHPERSNYETGIRIALMLLKKSDRFTDMFPESGD